MNLHGIPPMREKAAIERLPSATTALPPVPTLTLANDAKGGNAGFGD
jgi:hypothetical protein